MSLFDSLGGSRGNQGISREQAMQQLRSDPAAILKRAGLNVAPGMTDPQQMVMYLLQSGQIGKNFRKIR